MHNVILLFLCVFVLTSVEGIFANEIEKEEGQIVEPDEEEYVPDELLVKFKEGVRAESITAINEKVGTQVVNVLGEGRLYQLRIPPSAKLEEVMKTYKALPEVEYVEFNYIVGIE